MDRYKARELCCFIAYLGLEDVRGNRFDEKSKPINVDSKEWSGLHINRVLDNHIDGIVGNLFVILSFRDRGNGLRE